MTNSPPQFVRQEGITLFLSILVLSAITAVAFSLATITLIEVRSSGDVQRTEPAFYSDFGIAEEAIYGLKRKDATIDSNLGAICPDPPVFTSYTSPLDPVITSQVKQCNISDQNTVEVRIPPSAVDYSSSKRYYLFNPNDITGGGNYTQVKLTNTSPTATSVQFYICNLVNDCEANPGLFEPNSGPLSSEILPTGSVTFGLDSAKTYEIAVTNVSVNSQDAYVEIYTLGLSGSSLGMPFINKRAVEIESRFAGLTRRIQVLIPTQ